jgi:acyl-CoA thioester hydrolase
MAVTTCRFGFFTRTPIFPASSITPITFAEAQAETPGFAFVVRSMQIDFLKPARMDDVLDVVTWPVAVKGASITLGQEVQRGDDVLVKAQVRVAFISEGRAQPIPKALRVLLKADLI